MTGRLFLSVHLRTRPGSNSDTSQEELSGCTIKASIIFVVRFCFVILYKKSYPSINSLSNWFSLEFKKKILTVKPLETDIKFTTNNVHPIIVLVLKNRDIVSHTGSLEFKLRQMSFSFGEKFPALFLVFLMIRSINLDRC